MRFIFVNHCHPGTPHVCATRAREFAAGLTAASHQVVLLTAKLDGVPSVRAANGLSERLADHDWTQPFHLACDPRPSLALDILRSGRIPWPLRKVCTGGYYLAKGGMFTDWREGSRPIWPVLAKIFRPDAVWGVFGNTDAWIIARSIARIANCPWVADVKDHWSTFIPSPLRAPLARRFVDAAHITAFSRSHVERLTPWFSQPMTVVYSGISDDFLAPLPDTCPRDSFRLVLTGSLYEDDSLTALIECVRAWVSRLTATERAEVSLVYAGTDCSRLENASRPLVGLCRLETHDFLPLAQWRALTLSAHANLYIKSVATYHHKLIELLSANRPILCFPGEEAEAREVAASVGGTLYSCADCAALHAALDRVWNARHVPPPIADRARMAAYSWARQGKMLEAVLTNAKRKKVRP
jgi:hypothetical protein